MAFDWIIQLVMLSGMEIVLGIDNVIFIAILVGRLPQEQQPRGRQLGLGMALLTRLMLLFALSWIIGLQGKVFALSDFGIPGEWAQRPVSWRDLILLGGGLFLIAKSTFEIHHKLEGDEEEHTAAGKGKFGFIVFQVALLDIVFSLDSVITAVGMVLGESKGEVSHDKLAIMVGAVVISMVVMLFFAGAIGRFVYRHPTVKILALSFLILIGVSLVADGVGEHIPRGYIYFAMGFSFAVEMINLRIRSHTPPVRLHEPAPPPLLNGEIQPPSKPAGSPG